MDVDSVDAILTALTTAGAAGVVAGVQQVAGDAVKDGYRNLIQSVAKLLKRRSERAAPEITSDAIDTEILDLIRRHQHGTTVATTELRDRLVTVEESDETGEIVELAGALTSTPSLGGTFTDCIGVQYGGYRPSQTLNFGPEYFRARAGDPNRSDR